MHYGRHNFSHNFLNAIETDHMAAWDIYAHEVNELILDQPAEVEKTINGAGVTVLNNSPKGLLNAVYDNIDKNQKLRCGINKLVMARHKDNLVSAEGGAHDVCYNNASGDAGDSTDVENPEQVTAVNTGTEKLLGLQPNDNKLSVGKEAGKDLATKSLDNKIKYRSIGAGLKKLSPVKIAVGVVGAAILIWGLSKLFKAA